MKNTLDTTLSLTLQKKLDALRLGAEQKAQLQAVLQEAVAYMPSDLFGKPSAMEPILQRRVVPVAGAGLTGEQEYVLFMQMNYSRYRLGQLRNKLLRQRAWDRKTISELLACHDRQLAIRSDIVASNIGLVPGMLKHVHYSGVDYDELVSAGNMALLRAVEKFDCTRGLKFSTYACRAIFKAFSRAARNIYTYHNRFPVQWDPALQKDDSQELEVEYRRQDRLDQIRGIIDENTAALSNMEMEVVRMRFALDEQQEKPLTLKEVGHRLGLTKERIRQIQNKALAKLKGSAQEQLV